MTCRNLRDDAKTECVILARDESGGCLFIAQVVSGMKVARAWVGLLRGRREPVVSRDGQPVACGLRLARHGRIPNGRNREDKSTDAGRRGGPSGMSVEGPVMGPEQSGRVIQAWLLDNRDAVLAGGING
jgi:hypothetical protein